jgi:O-antigen/teichoic acid export membrane protein
VVGVAAALLGMGVWSLVLAWHVQTVTACLAMYYYSPRSLKPGNPFRRLGVAHFGGVVMVTNMINWVIDSGPHVAIGRWLGAALLGQYTIANNLVKVPADHLVRNLQTVLFPLAARAQDNDAGLRRAYLTVLAGVGVVSFPLFTFVALMAEPIVLMLLGTHWLEAAAVLVPLSIAMIGHAVEALCGPILSGRGEPGAELRVKTATLIVMLLVLAFTANWSLAAVGWGVAGVYAFRWLWMNATVMKRLQIPLHAIGVALLGPCRCAAGRQPCGAGARGIRRRRRADRRGCRRGSRRRPRPASAGAGGPPRQPAPGFRSHSGIPPHRGLRCAKQGLGSWI